jgi:hypothetical protein
VIKDEVSSEVRGLSEGVWIYFLENKICRVLNVDDEGATYSVQYTFEKMEDIETYQKNHATRLQAEHSQRYEGKYAAFRTLLEIM